jgi:hypothetical protein
MTIQNNQKICNGCGKEIRFSEFALYHYNKIRHFCNKSCFIDWVKKYIDFLEFDEEVKNA